MAILSSFLRMKLVGLNGRAYWTLKHVKQSNRKVNRHMILGEGKNGNHFIPTVVRGPDGPCMFNLVTNKTNVQCTTVQSMTSASAHTLEKVDQLCTCTTVMCHPCLVLHHSLHAIDLANARQWPLEWSSFHYTSPSMFRNHACHVEFFVGGQLDFFEGGQLSVRSHLAPHKATCLGCQAACHQYPASLGCLPL